jgi:hypothetical protein
MAQIPIDLSEQFKELFVNHVEDNKNSFLKKEALYGRLRLYNIRSLAWKVLLGVVKLDLSNFSVSDKKDLFTNVVNQWLEQSQKSRNLYNELYTKAQLNPTLTKDVDPQQNNPLAPTSNSPWMQFFRDHELKKDIEQDLARLNPENDFFQNSDILEMMKRILFVYAKENPHISYRQGMHELLANIIYLLHREKLQRSPSNVLSELLDATYIEHDAYFLFDALMQRQQRWFLPAPSSSPNSSTSQDNMSPLMKKSAHIQHELLQKHDNQLYLHFQTLRIEPQLYLLRWIRLLFGREFHIEDVLVIWEAIFAFDDDFTLVDHIAVSMLIFIRGQLLQRDYSECLRRLFKYPPVEDISVFIEHGIKLAKGILPEKSSPPTSSSLKRPVSVAAACNPSITSNMSTVSNLSTLSNGPNLRPEFRRLSQVLTAKSRSVSQGSAPDEVTHLREVQQYVGTRLTELTYILQEELLGNAQLAESLTENTLLAIAELKRLKDILYGNLPLDLATPFYPLNSKSSAASSTVSNYTDKSKNENTKVTLSSSAMATTLSIFEDPEKHVTEISGTSADAAKIVSTISKG